MQIAKKYLTEGLIQLTILLSLIGVRVDIDSYLSGYYTPLGEINLGPSSAYTQTPFHNLRDTLDGYSVHPKCPELDYFFSSRRLLDEVRALGSPRFPTELSTWLVHQVPASDRAERGPSTSNDTGSVLEQQLGDDATEHPPVSVQDVHQPNRGLIEAACNTVQDDEIKIKEEEEPAPLTQLAHSSTLEEESLFDSIAALSNQIQPSPLPPAIDDDQHWSSLLSLTDLDDLDPLVTERLSDLDTEITGAISLHDAMLTSTGTFGSTPGGTDFRPVTQPQRTLFRLESTDSTHTDLSPRMALASLQFTSMSNLTRSESLHGSLGDCMDEAVFDQINQLGLESLDTIDSQLMDTLGGIEPGLEDLDLDSDSGLSLESSSRGPVSPGSSEMSSSSSSYCDDEGGATGYSSEVDSVPSKHITDYNTTWSPVDLSENVWHDHSYSTPALFNPPPAMLPHKAIKEEFISDDEDEMQLGERDISRDELRARAMCLPFSVLQIVNMPVEEFLEVLEGHGFSPQQVTLLRDIRRRGKNKLAAQNCRKRKLDAITGLREEVEKLQAQKDRLLREKRLTTKTIGAVGHQIKQLTRDVLARLRDDSGRPLTPDRYTLQCGANGRVVVQPVRRPAITTSASSKTDKRKKEKKQ
ncbi:nuclear factor erythroid 2-related factor 3 [Gouania willdenowi]|uniref:Endoplasmic reticulum membrane sensor NFE2L1-like n=1 Tax=Gouania willdenowi TaxID=441366 RepID=A0A8C5DZ62_GOUWI|nr:endoplasmic reticulum membrane sensor NFE2L1-like [Gouania willdenowi]